MGYDMVLVTVILYGPLGEGKPYRGYDMVVVQRRLIGGLWGKV